MGQSWQNVLGSRVPSTNYFNTTNRTIVASVTACAPWETINGYVGGLLIAAQWNGTSNSDCESINLIVPPGANYSVSTSSALNYWVELR